MEELGKNFDKKDFGLLITGFAFAFFFVIGCYNLSHSGLWYDETVEFYYSKIMKGQLPWGSNTNSMYERIVSTYQPPLYNFLMYFWLKISEGEWWFRFFGVIAGLFGAIGVYKTIDLLLNSKVKASFAVIFYAILPRQVYYIQEASEYCLLLGFLPWCIYFFISVIQNPAKTNIILFAIFSILSVYSQYGAIFPVTIMLLLVLFNILRKKDKKLTKIILIVYGICFLVAAFPLYFFFIRIQIKSQATQASWAGNDFFSVKNLFLSPLKISKYLLIEKAIIKERLETLIFYVIIFICISFSIFKCKKNEKRELKYFYASFYLTYFLFALAVSLHLYAYGSFTPNRYKLFLLPQLFIFVFVSLCKLQDTAKLRNKKFKNITIIAKGCFIIFIAIFTIENFTITKKNWEKQKIREAVQIWYKDGLYKNPTYVYRNASSGFYYYATHNDKFNQNILNNVIFQKRLSNAYEQTEKNILEDFNQKLPDELCIIASHIDNNNFSPIVKVFEKKEYEKKEKFNKWAKIILLKNKTIPLHTARFDIKVENPELPESNIKFEILNPSNKANFHTPQWFGKNGVGYVFQSSDSTAQIKVTCLNDGKFLLWLRGKDIRKNGKRLPIFVKYESLKINGENILSEAKSFSHDKPFKYELDVKKGDVLNVEAVWSEHDYATKEERDTMIKQLLEKD